MKRLAFLPLIAVALAACSESATAPTSEHRPLLAVSPGTYTATISPANAPSGTHLQAGSIGCTVGTDLSVSCSSFQLAGVGNTNVTLVLQANYTATVDCFNHGTNPNNPIESHTTSFSSGVTTTVPSTKNGRLTVPQESASPGSVTQVCPNPNWTPQIRAGTLQLASLTYTVTFAGFTSPYISISQS